MRFPFPSHRESLLRATGWWALVACHGIAASAFGAGTNIAGPLYSGTVWHNRGVDEWRKGHPGAAILSWERALWMEPTLQSSRQNLEFARRTRQLTAPELSWPEQFSTFLPSRGWKWLAAGGLWMALGFTVVPGRLPWRAPVPRRQGANGSWHQVAAASGFSVLLLTLPALAGAHSRAGLGVVIESNTRLRLTPTRDGQALALLKGGEAARWIRTRGEYVRVRTIDSTEGWVLASQFQRFADTRSPIPEGLALEDLLDRKRERIDPASPAPGSNTASTLGSATHSVLPPGPTPPRSRSRDLRPPILRAEVATESPSGPGSPGSPAGSRPVLPVDAPDEMTDQSQPVVSETPNPTQP